MTGLYLHIPFCWKKCNYCSFSSFPGRESLYTRYVSSLCKELQILSHEHKERIVDTVFLGGGTPTVIGSDLLSQIIDYIFAQFHIADGAEISIEVNPKTINFSGLSRLRRAGINRISIGVQSLNDTELKTLARIHSATEATDCFTLARRAGFSNISIDLMYGLPGQTVGSWEKTLATVVGMKPEHLSLYQLSIEPGTRFFSLYEQGKLTLPAEEDILMMDEVTERFCNSGPYRRYEISNFSLLGYQCLHNVNYWKNGNYLAAGAGAVSCIDSVRCRRCESPEEYMNKIDQAASLYVETEKLSLEASFRETVIMGLRLIDGVAMGRLQKRYGIDLLEYYGSTVTKLVAADYLIIEGGRMRLSPSGLQVANSIMAELV